MNDRVFAVGDYVRIKTDDGAEFEGVLQDFTEDYLLLNGYGFASDTVKEMWVP
jgi:hypothetical protein